MSNDPKRLFEDPATSLRVRDDLERSISTQLHEYDVAKGLSRLLAVTAVGSATASVASSTKAAWLASLVKWGLWGGAAIVATGISAQLILAPGHRSDPVQSALPAVRPPAVAAPAGVGDVPSIPPAAPTVATESPAVDVPPPVSAPTAVSHGSGRLREERSRGGAAPEQPGGPALAAGTHGSHLRQRERVDSPGAREPTTDESVAREVALLGRARAALTADPAEALLLTRQGQREFPRGVLGEEREAIAVLALVRLGQRAEGAARGQEFLTRYPNGPFTERVRLALGTFNGTLNAGTPR